MAARRLLTRASLARDLRQLGVEPGMSLIVHSSLKSLGYVCGGPVAVIQALMESVTFRGTLVMPTQSGDHSDPRHWSSPPVPRSWWPTMRRTMPAYDPRYTPTLGMGAVPEAFRKFPGVVRSRHPAYSFAAWGAAARWMISGQSLDDEMGRTSPLGRLQERDGRILLLGVGYDVSTSLHLAESLIPEWPRVRTGGPVLVRGRRRWLTWNEVDGDDARFPALGRAFERVHPVAVRRVGQAPARLIPQRALVEFAVPWLRRHLPGKASPRG